MNIVFQDVCAAIYNIPYIAKILRFQYFSVVEQYSRNLVMNIIIMLWYNMSTVANEYCFPGISTQ